MKGFMWACLMCLGVVVVLSPGVSAGDKVITGRALYRERIALPPNAVFEAVLEDISLTDVKAGEIARTRIVDPGNPPIDFAIVYDPEWIKANRTYAVKGRILVEGRPMFVSDMVHRVLTADALGDLEIVMRMTNHDRPSSKGVEVVERFVSLWPGERCERARADVELTDTSWRAVRLGGDDVIQVEGRHEPNILLHSRDGRYSATVGCNRITGSYVLDGSELTFSPGPTTLMACPPPLEELERRLLQSLVNTATWTINGNTLELRDPEGDPAALFQAVYLY